MWDDSAYINQPLETTIIGLGVAGTTARAAKGEVGWPFSNPLTIGENRLLALGGDPNAIGRGLFELAAMAVPVAKARYVDTVGDVGKLAGRGTQGPVIIGETMARVEAAAAKYPGAKILNDMPDFRAMGMTDYEVTGAMMRYNRQWLLE